MANLTIKNLEDEIVEILNQRAKSHNRSLEAEARQILTDTAKPGVASDFRSLAERIAKMSPGVGHTDGADLLRTDRRR